MTAFRFRTLQVLGIGSQGIRRNTVYQDRWPDPAFGRGGGGRSSSAPIPPIPGFELHTAWKKAATGSWRVRQGEEPVMAVAKKAKHEGKAAKSKSKKDAGKVKHKGKKVKNAAKH